MTAQEKQAVADAIQSEIAQLATMLIATPEQTTPGRTAVKILAGIRLRQDALVTLEALPLAD